MIARSVLFVCAALIAGGAESPTVDWVFRAGGPMHDKIRALTVDHEGNTYLTGEFSEVARFGGTRLTSKGALDIVVAKLGPDGRLDWARSIGGEKIDRGYAIGVDGDGNSYVTGHFQSETVAFGSTVLTNRGDYDVFIAQFDSEGHPMWATSAGGEGYDFGHGLGIDPNGGVVVSGMVRGQGAFGAVATEPGGMGPFVASYTFNGKLRWLRQMVGRGSGSGHELCLDREGNVYLGGFVAGSGRLGAHLVKTTAGRDLFVAKLNRNQQWEWVTQGGGAADGLVSGMAVDHQGNCHIAGMFKATARLGGKNYQSVGDNDFYVSQLDPEGNVTWTVHAGGPSIDYGLGLAIDQSGNALLTGETTGTVIVAGHTFRQIGRRDLYAAKFKPDGKLLWAWQAGGTLNSLSYAAGCGPRGLNVIAGAFSGEFRVDGKSLVSHGSNDIIVVGLRD